MPKTLETVLEIDLGALEHNYRFFKSKIKSETKFLAVVKAFAYGSDAVTIARKLVNSGVDYLAVAYVSEGVILREAGIDIPILVLHPQPTNFKLLIQYNLEPSLYSPRILMGFLEVAAEQNLNQFPVHIKFNTGLNRLGFWESDVDFIIEKIRDRKELKLVSVFSHLAASEDENERAFSKNQIAAFEKVADRLRSEFKDPPFRHMLNTSGILNYPEAHYEMVRSGIGIYGYANDPDIDKQLRPVLTLKSVISQIHKIEPNETVGYNRAFTSDSYRMSATVPLGHADGIGRHYGNGKGSVLINGERAAIIGNVCMDMMMIDVTGINCKEGDEVVVFGSGKSAEDLAASAGTISYELITGISQRVKRVVV